MDEFPDIWIEQCDAAREIRDAWGIRKALGYLVGERLLNYLRASDADPSWAEKLPLFVAEVKRIFTAEELRGYFATTTRVGPAAHVTTDEQYLTMRDAGAFGLMWSAEQRTPSFSSEQERRSSQFCPS